MKVRLRNGLEYYINKLNNIVTNMKRLLLVLIILCCLCSCKERVYKEVDGRQIELIDNAPYNMRYVEFDGHEYTLYASGYHGSLCHSPKCKCLSEYKK